MSQKEIELLKEQVVQLNSRKFDLEAWKAHTLIFISRIFGSNSEHAKQIRLLKYDYSSWNLRDSSGGVQLSDPVREKAREILNAAIKEIEVLGIPDNENKLPEISDIFRNELTGREIDELEKLLSLPSDKKKEALTNFIKSKEKEVLCSILVEYLINQ